MMRNFVFLLLFVFGGCAVTTPTQYWEEATSFKDYAEQVFRRQNNVSSEILMLSEEDLEAQSYAALLQAEQDLQAACQLLNEYAIRKRDGLDIGFMFKRAVKNSVASCEQAIEKAETLLDAAFS